MKELLILIKRNTKLFFKDKAMFFTALITPGILLVLYATFLGNIYRDSFEMAIPSVFSVSDKLFDAAVGGQLISSILSVSCVTVAFCTNMLSIADKATGRIKDFTISPVSPTRLALGYYVSAFISTITVSLASTLICFGYIAITGWFLSFTDVLMILLDVFILTLFGVALSSLISFFLSTQGQISAIGTIISSCYGFICGAYMPISQFSEGLRNAVGVLPGTWGTSLLRTHALRGVFLQMENEGIPTECTDAMRDMTDCNIYFLENRISEEFMIPALLLASVLLILLFVLFHLIKIRKSTK